MTRTPYELTFFGVPVWPNSGKPIAYKRLHKTEESACATAHRVLDILSGYYNGNRAATPAIILHNGKQIRSVF